MGKQRIIWFGFGHLDCDETVPERNRNRFDGYSQGARISVVLVNDPEAEAHGVKIQVLRHGMMVVSGSRRAMLIGRVVGSMGMVGMGLMRRIRPGMSHLGVPMRRDLKQVRNSQGQDNGRT